MSEVHKDETPAQRAEHKSEAPAHRTESKPAVKPGPKAQASESGDPEVHRLLAERQTIRMNQATVEVSPEQKLAHETADKRLEEISKELGELGFE